MCTVCGSSDLHLVGFVSAGRATYRYCRRCERGWWESQGQKVEKATILEAAAAIKPARGR